MDFRDTVLNRFKVLDDVLEIVGNLQFLESHLEESPDGIEKEDIENIEEATRLMERVNSSLANRDD